MERSERIKRIVHRYRLLSIWMVCGMALAGFFFVSVGDLKDHVYSVAFCSLYQLVINSVSICAWRYVAVHSPNVMNRYYMACGSIRMLLALMVVQKCVLYVRLYLKQRSSLLWRSRNKKEKIKI